MAEPLLTTDTETLKSCCASLYASDWAGLLLGDSLHPGGMALTGRLGELLDLRPGHRVLDVAAGKGTSAVFLTQRFGCEVVGVDYGADLVAEATALAEDAGLADRVRFEQGDAEGLRFAEGTFDAIICECAFCTFPDKSAAAAEFSRVLRPSGRLGLSDLTRSGDLPSSLSSLLAWIACVADAQPIHDYVTYLENAGFAVDYVEPHNAALTDMIRSIQAKLLSAEVLMKLGKLDLPGADFDQTKALVRSATDSVRGGQLGYAMIAGTKASS